MDKQLYSAVFDGDWKMASVLVDSNHFSVDTLNKAMSEYCNDMITYVVLRAAGATAVWDETKPCTPRLRPSKHTLAGGRRR